jgi:hypothetical protein
LGVHIRTGWRRAKVDRGAAAACRQPGLLERRLIDLTGVIQQEHERHQRWLDRGLPDPIWVLTVEDMMERIYGYSNFVSANRAVLDEWFAENGDAEKPRNW